MRSISRFRHAPLLLLLSPVTLLLQAQTPAAAPPPQAAAVTPAQQLAADTAQLQQLAVELKAAMDKSTKDTLSMPVIKKAQEVEKLAHKVRDEMRASLAHGA